MCYLTTKLHPTTHALHPTSFKLQQHILQVIFPLTTAYTLQTIYILQPSLSNKTPYNLNPTISSFQYIIVVLFQLSHPALLFLQTTTYTLHPSILQSTPYNLQPTTFGVSASKSHQYPEHSIVIAIAIKTLQCSDITGFFKGYFRALPQFREGAIIQPLVKHNYAGIK